MEIFVKNIYISIFSFDNKLDFQNGYVRCELRYSENMSLKDLLSNIKNDDFSNKTFGVNLDYIYCKINGIAVFENLNVVDLVERFGNVWTIDPISKKFATKDLLIDFELISLRYSNFFQSSPFITNEEQKEFKKYLLINFICDSYHNDYLGDGFFLYIKWLIERHEAKKEYLLKIISNKNEGIMNHVPISSLIFPENKIIDSKIEYLQNLLINASKCPFKNGEWVWIGTEIENNYKLNPMYKIEIDLI